MIIGGINTTATNTVLGTSSAPIQGCTVEVDHCMNSNAELCYIVRVQDISPNGFDHDTAITHAHQLHEMWKIEAGYRL